MVFFAQHFVAGGKIRTFLHFEPFEYGDQFRRILASLEMRFLDAEF